MKRIKIILTLIVFTSFAYGQESETPMNNIKVNIFSPIVKTGSFFYERKINTNSSAQLGVGFTAYNREGIKINGLFFTPEYRFYLSSSKEALEGFYVGPYLRYQNLKIEDTQVSEEPSKATLSTFGGGVVVGHQWIFKNIFSLDVFLGPNYNSGTIKITSGDEPDIPASFEGFGARFGLTFGVAF